MGYSRKLTNRLTEHSQIFFVNLYVNFVFCKHLECILVLVFVIYGYVVDVGRVFNVIKSEFLFLYSVGLDISDLTYFKAKDRDQVDELTEHHNQLIIACGKRLFLYFFQTHEQKVHVC